MIGRDTGRLDAARGKIAEGLAQFVERGVLSAGFVEAAMGRVVVSTDLSAAAGAEMVVEAVTEDIPLKNKIFAALDSICAPPCILASSSGQPASALIEKVKHPERVIAAHFWYPAPLIPVVEVCPGPKTDPAVVSRTMEILRSAGKDPVEMTQELPGMIGNRIQFAILREAWALWASGAASAEAIDTVVKKTIGRRLGITGPIESAELGGLDTLHAFAESLLPHIDAAPEPASKVPRTVEELAGQTMRSSKEGLEKAGQAIGGSAKKAGEGIGKAGTAIGQAASNTWTCITSLFSSCGGEPESEPQPHE